MDGRKFEAIIHVTDEDCAARLIRSLRKVVVPKSFALEVQPLTGAEKYFIYETARLASDAKYKIYLDERATVTNEYFLFELLGIFDSDKKIGAVVTKMIQPFEAAIADGFFFATQYDLPWRHELFTDNFFGGQAQCMEFKRAGYEISGGGDWISVSDDSWALDETFRKKFLDEYNLNEERD